MTMARMPAPGWIAATRASAADAARRPNFILFLMRRSVPRATTLLLIASAAAAGADDERPAVEWSDDIRIRGEFADTKLPGVEASRLLLRARLAVEARSIAPNLAAGLGLRASDPDDPREPDAGFGSLDPEPEPRLDLAWIRWTPDAAPGLALTAGRMAMPLLNVRDLLFDADWTPAGAAVVWSPGGEAWRPHLRGAAFALFEQSDRDLWMGSGQAAIEFRRGPEWRAIGGAGYHAIDAAGREAGLPRPSAGGNSLRTDGATGAPAWDRDYRIVEPFAQLTWDPWFPVTIYGQGAVNTAAGDDKTGWLAGVTLGRARAIGALELGWNVRRLEADAAFSALADSDFAGGGTDVEGHAFHARYHAIRNAWIGVEWFAGLRDPDGARRSDRLWRADVTVRF